ncbi:MAG: YceI family protein [Chloroflexi bacterium]|nr:YceI family protein [Chloroflexota bacterium]
MALWTFDPMHTKAVFNARHMMITNVNGEFSDVSGTITFDPANPAAASVEATVQVASLATGVSDRDNHLRSPDFLDAQNHPTITFKSTRVEPSDDTHARVIGDLTIRGTTREVSMDVEFLGATDSLFGDYRAGFLGTTTINREDWGLTWNQVMESGGVLVGKEIKITLDVQAIRQGETEAAS